MGIILTFFVFVILSISIVGFSLHYGISPMPSSRKARRAILSLIPKDQKLIYDLGSGWGHLVFSLAKTFRKTQIIGVEGSFFPRLFSLIFRIFFSFSNTTIIGLNFFKISLREADGVVCYLYPGAMSTLKKKFEQELRPSAFVITHTFAIPGWKPNRVIELDDLWKSKIYLYYG